MLSVNGRVRWERRRYQGITAGVGGVDPLVDAAGAVISLGARESCCLVAGSCRNFERGALILKKTAGVELSGEKLRQVVEREGKRVVEAQRQEQLEFDFCARDCVTAQVGGRADRGEAASVRRVYAGCDGVLTPAVTEGEKNKRREKIKQKREARKRRGGRCAPLPRARPGADQSYKEQKLVVFYDQSRQHRHVALTRKDHRQAGLIMRRDGARLGLRQADEVVAIVDGAPWIASQLHKQLPGNKQGDKTVLLDFYHLAENVHKGRRGTYGEESVEGRAWAEQVLEQARSGFAPLWEMLTAWRQKLRSPAKRRAADTLLHYVSERRDMIAYAPAQARGQDIGSGPTEAMCKCLTQRLKGAGMRWDMDNAEAMAALEALHQSNEWNAYWRKCVWQMN